jgi:hypothetical protein
MWLLLFAVAPAAKSSHAWYRANTGKPISSGISKAEVGALTSFF